MSSTQAQRADRSGHEHERFTSELRSFLQEHHPGRAPRDPAAGLAHQRDWQATLADAGWIAPGWPLEWGGMGLPLGLQTIYHREMALARAPMPPNSFVGIVGPTILRHGSDGQRHRYLRPMLRADELWCQGFSEPEAGSDLASLRTRAILDGDSYRFTGRKIWTSRAQIADFMLLLVRTGTQESRARGITCLILDMTTPGVEVRAIRDMAGGSHFAEVTFDDVVVPTANRIGDHDDGWRCARATLGHERSTSLTAAAVRYQRVVRDLTDLARERGALSDERTREEIVQLVIGARLLELNGRRVLGRVVQGGEPGPVSSVIRLQHGRFEQRLHETAMDLLGPDAMLDATHDRLGSNGRWVKGFLRTRASTIGAGTAEIQRNTIAEKVLGLPADREAQ